MHDQIELQVGMAGALETLCGQAFGARQYRLLGVYSQRAMVVLALACVPIVVLWANNARKIGRASCRERVYVLV